MCSPAGEKPRFWRGRGREGGRSDFSSPIVAVVQVGQPWWLFSIHHTTSGCALVLWGKNEEEVLLLDIGGKGKGNLSSLS